MASSPYRPLFRTLSSRLAFALVLPAALALSACGERNKPPAPVPAPAEAKGTSWLNEGVILYMPDNRMKERIKVEDMAPYMRAVDAAATTAILARPAETGSSGVLLVAMRPGGQSKAWVTTGEPKMSEDTAASLITAAQSVPVPPINTGTVLVGIKFHAFGGGFMPVGPNPPIPLDWYSHLSKHGGLLDDALMEKVWPLETAQ